MSKVTEKKVVLQYPFTFGETEEVTEIILKRPKGKHLRKLPMEPQTGDLMDLAAKLCDRPPSFMDELDALDVIAVAEVVQGFLENGQKTGRNG
jgi:hypothetical protein